MAAEPEDAIPPGYELEPPHSEPAEVETPATKEEGWSVLGMFGIPWVAGGAWLELAGRSGWVSLVMGGGVIFGLSGFLGEDNAGILFVGGALLALGAYIYGVVTSHDSILILSCLGVWMAAALMIFGGALLIADSPRSRDLGPAGEDPDPQPEPHPEPRDRVVGGDG